MRHIALIDQKTLIVTNVIDAMDDLDGFPNVKDFCAALGIPQLAEETFQDQETKPEGALKNYAVIGHILDVKNGGFIAPKPMNISDAVIDSVTLKWIDPVKSPDAIPLTDSVALKNSR